MTHNSFKINSQISDLVSQSIFVTGSARSGTTIIGKLMYSLQHVEYLYEPPLLYSLLPSLHNMPKETWCLLFETYLFEDFLVNALSGRHINLNEHDDSSIYHAKDQVEIENRLSHSWRKQEIFENALSKHIAFKVPGMTLYLTEILALYPSLRILVTVRRPDSVLASILRKNWFSDQSLQAFATVWPSRTGYEICVPFWVPTQNIEQWLRASEIERCCLYYCWMCESVSTLDSLFVVDYDIWLSQPKAVFEQIVDGLGLCFGEKTDSLLAQINYQPTSTQIDLDMLPASFRKRVENAYHQCLACAIGAP